MCFSKVFDLPGPPKRVLGSGRPVRGGGDGDGGGDGGDENDDFWWFLDLNRSPKTRLGIVRPVVSSFKPHWSHFHWWWSLKSWGNDDDDA